MTLFFKRIIIQLSVSFLSYSVFNEHVTFFEKKGNQRNFKLLYFVVYGRTKWTRTTDLVLIRHAL